MPIDSANAPEWLPPLGKSARTVPAHHQPLPDEIRLGQQSDLAPCIVAVPSGGSPPHASSEGSAFSAHRASASPVAARPGRALSLAVFTIVNTLRTAPVGVPSTEVLYRHCFQSHALSAL